MRTPGKQRYGFLQKVPGPTPEPTPGGALPFPPHLPALANPFSPGLSHFGSGEASPGLHGETKPC